MWERCSRCARNLTLHFWCDSSATVLAPSVFICISYFKEELLCKLNSVVFSISICSVIGILFICLCMGGWKMHLIRRIYEEDIAFLIKFLKIFLDFFVPWRCTPGGEEARQIGRRVCAAVKCIFFCGNGLWGCTFWSNELGKIANFFFCSKRVEHFWRVHSNFMNFTWCKFQSNFFAADIPSVGKPTGIT